MSITQPAKIVLELNGITYTVEGLAWDIGAEDLVDYFKRMLVCAGFPSDILK